MRNVLIVSYYFPPSGGPGVQRVLKFTRYLPACGYRPLVLTVPETAAFPVLDPGLLREIPGEAKVFRAPLLEFYGLYRRAAGRPAGAPVNLSTSAREARGLRQRLGQAMRGAFFIPDGRMGWLPWGTRAGLHIAREENAELIFASGPPFTAHLIARRVAEKTGLPLVLDFRDPWTRAPFYPARPAWARRRDQALERSCLARASAIVTVNRRIRDDFLSLPDGPEAKRIHVITNGYDPSDFAGRTAAPPSRWTLTHTGTLPTARFPAAFVPAVRALLESEPGLAARMQIRLVGSCEPELARALSAPPLAEVVRLEGYRPHEESTQALLDSHLLLLFIETGPEARGILTGKLFEYLGSGRPILALAPEGEAAEVIRSSRAGMVVSGDDVAGLTAALREAFAAWRDGRRPFGEPDREAVARFARPRLTARLAEVFDQVLAGGSPP